jgi:pyridoxine kinase
VGNAAITLPLQRLGFEVWPVDTVRFSNHPAHGSYTGQIISACEIAALIDGIEQRALLQSCTAVLSGYLGSAANGHIILEIVDRVKAQNKRALFLCDPVMGDNSQPYVEKDILAFFKDKLAASADIMTPNNYEASILIGEPVDTKQKAIKALPILCAKGVKIAIITGIETDGGIETVARDENGTWSVLTPKIPVASSGAGDLFSALFLAKYLDENSTPHALSYAISAVYSVLDVARELSAPDLPIVAAQELILSPPAHYKAESVT